MQRETASDKYSAASGLASAISESAASYGIDIEPICKAIGLDPASFQEMTGRISLERLCRLFESCAVISNDENFALKTVGFFKPGASGPFGFGIMVAPTVLDYFRFMGQYLNCLAETSYSKFTLSDDAAEMVWTYSPLLVKRDQFVDFLTALGLARLRDILGPDVDQVEVGLERPKPANIGPFRARMSKNVSFGRRINSLKVPASLLSIVNPKGDRRLFTLMETQCAALMPKRKENPDFAEELREYILARISDDGINLPSAAHFFHVSERTLQRRLSEMGTSLADIRDEVRRDLAERMLTGMDISASEIAHRLGYSAPSAFTRSTLRWFGKTPRDFRKTAALSG